MTVLRTDSAARNVSIRLRFLPVPGNLSNCRSSAALASFFLSLNRWWSKRLRSLNDLDVPTRVLNILTAYIFKTICWIEKPWTCTLWRRNLSTGIFLTGNWWIRIVTYKSLACIFLCYVISFCRYWHLLSFCGARFINWSEETVYQLVNSVGHIRRIFFAHLKYLKVYFSALIIRVFFVYSFVFKIVLFCVFICL